MKMRFAPVLMVVLLVSACSSDTAPLTISDVTVARPKPGMQMTAGYFTMTNHTPQVIVITAVSSPQFGSVEMHESIVEDGMARMVELGDLTLPPNSSVEFRPGGKHLMLMRPAEELNTITLEFLAGDFIMLSVSATVGD